MDSSLGAFVTSTFGKHGLLTVMSIMATALSGCIPLVIAKVIDVFGRVEGFFVMLIIIVVGMAMKAACLNVQTYFAGHILYWAGHIGVLFVCDIMAADITTLKNRMIIFTINGTPRIAATFAGPRIAENFWFSPNWRWGYGAFIIIFCGISLPAMILMIVMYRRAKKAGLIKKVTSDRNVFQSLWFYFVQFDSKSHAVPESSCTSANILSSLRYYPPHVRMVPLCAAFQSRHLRSARLEDPLHHRLHRPRSLPFPCLLHLGSQVRAIPIPALALPQEPHHYRLLPALWCHVPFRLLLERILQFVPDRRTQAEHYKRWIHPKRLLAHFFHVQPAYRVVDPSFR